jgi:hypothetical protein
MIPTEQRSGTQRGLHQYAAGSRSPTQLPLFRFTVQWQKWISVFTFIGTERFEYLYIGETDGKQYGGAAHASKPNE